MMRRRKKAPMAEINITPFTDVVLVLLIIFVVAAPIVFRDDIKVTLPKSYSGGKAPAAPRNYTLTISRSDQVYFNNARYSVQGDIGALKSDLETLLRGTKDPVVTINGDRDCKYDSIVKIMSVLNLAGVKNILLGVEKQR